MTTDEITVSRCSRVDVDAVLELWESTRSSHASLPDRRADIERLTESSPAALLVAKTGDRIVGAVIAGWDGWRGNIYRLAVHDEYRLRGVGRGLVSAAEDYLYDRGIRRVTALVAYDDEVAGSFWDAAGYPQDADIGRRVRNLGRDRPGPEATRSGDPDPVLGLDHVQVAAPPGCESDARAFYGKILGLSELEKPPALQGRGGVWFACGSGQLHVGVSESFSPATKAHPALSVREAGLDRLAERLAEAGSTVQWDDAIPGTRRFYTADPWGNRVELLAAD